LLSKELHFFDDNVYNTLIVEIIGIKQMLATLIKKLRADR